jgi:hypothetical protein
MEQFHILRTVLLGHQIEKTHVGRACSTYGEMGGAYRVLVGKPETRRPLGRPRSRCDYKLK